jgi:hypothetical protein
MATRAAFAIVRHPMFMTALNFGIAVGTQLIRAKTSTFGNHYYSDDDNEEPRRRNIILPTLVLLYALYVSYQLNRNPGIRQMLGFSKGANFFTLIVSFFFVAFVGPVVYLLTILTGIMELISKYLAPTNLEIKTTWFDALAKAGETDVLLKIFTLLHQ